MSRTLLVLRHCRASQDGSSDLARHLEPEGRAQGVETGRWLAASEIVPDAAVVSAATRAQETYAAVAEGAGWDLPAEVDLALYHADPEAALDLCRLVDDAAQTLVLVGHNPTVGTLAQLLDNGEGDAAADVAMAYGFPAGSTAIFTFEGGWDELSWASARLVAFRPGA